AVGGAAFYALRPGSWRDYWTLLHPPYTLWHLSYVLLGASLSPAPDARIVAGALLAFFLGVGVAAHSFDELQGRPLGTRIPLAAPLLGLAQRRLSTPVRRIRRKARDVTGTITFRDGTTEALDRRALIAAPEGALRLLWLATVALSIGLLLVRWAG